MATQAPSAEYARILAENERYAAQFDHSGLPLPPGRKLAVLACMDARLTVEDVLGLRTGDAHIIRNAGGLATDDAIRSLVISQNLLGTTPQGDEHIVGQRRVDLGERLSSLLLLTLAGELLVDPGFRLPLGLFRVLHIIPRL